MKRFLLPDMQSLGFGLTWGTQLTLLFSNTLFITVHYRGADAFNYSLGIGVILASVFIFLLSRRLSSVILTSPSVLQRAMLVHAGLLLVCIALIGMATPVEGFLVIQSFAGLLGGCGLGLGILIWMRLYSLRSFNEARSSLLCALVLGVIMFALLAWVSPIVRLVGLALAALISGWCGYRYAGKPGEPEEESAIVEKSALLDNRVTCAAVLALGFVYGISGIISLNNTPELSTGHLGLLSHLLMFAVSIVLLTSITVMLPRKASIALLFQIVFPIVVAALIFLPFAPEWYTYIYGVIVAESYQLTEVLLFFSFATITSRSLYYRTSCLPLACMWTGITLGLVAGERLFSGHYDEFFIMTAVTIVALYLLSMVLFLLFSLRKKQGELVAASEVRPKEAPAEKDELEKACSEVAGGYSLSEREAEIMEYIARGRSGTFIAEKLYLSPNTVKGYTKSLYTKLDAHSKQDVIDLIEGVQETERLQTGTGS